MAEWFDAHPSGDPRKMMVTEYMHWFGGLTFEVVKYYREQYAAQVTQQEEDEEDKAQRSARGSRSPRRGNHPGGSSADDTDTLLAKVRLLDKRVGTMDRDVRDIRKDVKAVLGSVGGIVLQLQTMTDLLAQQQRLMRARAPPAAQTVRKSASDEDGELHVGETDSPSVDQSEDPSEDSSADLSEDQSGSLHQPEADDVPLGDEAAEEEEEEDGQVPTMHITRDQPSGRFERPSGGKKRRREDVDLVATGAGPGGDDDSRDADSPLPKKRFRVGETAKANHVIRT